VPEAVTTFALAILMGSTQVGLAVGSSFAAFEPYWITGPYAGTNQCPVCEYTFLPMVYVYAKQPSNNLILVAKALQSAVDQVGADKIKTFIIDPNLAGKDKESISTFEPWAKKAETPKVWWLSRPKKLSATIKNHGLESPGEWSSIAYFVKGRKVRSVIVAGPNEQLDPAAIKEAAIKLAQP